MSVERRIRPAGRELWERRVPWDGPDPKPGETIETRSPDHVWLIEAVEPLRHHDPDGARLILRLSRRSAGSFVHGMRRMALSNPAGPARVRQLAGEGPTAIEQTKWRDPDDNRPNASRRPRQITGFRKFCPLRRMSALPNSRVTDLQIAAADRLRASYDLATIGSSTPAEAGARMPPGPKLGPSATAIEQAAALSSVERTFARIPEPLIGLTNAVILRNRSLQGWCTDEAARLGSAPDPKVELGRLLSILDLLVAHYDLTAAD